MRVLFFRQGCGEGRSGYSAFARVEVYSSRCTMTTAHPTLPTYQFGSFLRRLPPPDDMKIPSLGRPRSAMVGGPPQRSAVVYRFDTNGDAFVLRKPDGTPRFPRPHSGPPRYVQLAGPVRGSEITTRSMHTWIPRSMPPVPTQKGRTATISFKPIVPGDYAYPVPRREPRPWNQPRR